MSKTLMNMDLEELKKRNKRKTAIKLVKLFNQLSKKGEVYCSARGLDTYKDEEWILLYKDWILPRDECEYEKIDGNLYQLCNQINNKELIKDIITIDTHTINFIKYFFNITEEDLK